jgi:hypothetical protein
LAIIPQLGPEPDAWIFAVVLQDHLTMDAERSG